MAESGEEEVTWVDLTRNTAGQHVVREANRRHIQEGAEAARSWRVGAEGEHRVAEILTQLTDRSWRDRLRRRTPAWCALQSVEVGTGRSDIDHIVFGPPGVFTINTKHHPHGKVQIVGDTIQVNRHDTEYVPKAQAEAKRATKLLRAALQHADATELAQRLTVQPVIALVGAQLLNRGRPGGVLVAKAKDLPFYLRQLPEYYSTADVQRIFEFASRSTTWKTPGPGPRKAGPPEQPAYRTEDAPQIEGRMDDQTWSGLCYKIKGLHEVLLRQGQVLEPHMHAYSRGVQVGVVGLRPVYQGSDAVIGIVEMGSLAAAARANEVVVSWETADLAAACKTPLLHPGTSLNILRAIAGSHVHHRFPYHEHAPSDGSIAIRPEWLAPAPEVQNGHLEPAIAGLLEHSFQPLDSTDPDLLEIAATQLKTDGYNVTLYR